MNVSSCLGIVFSYFQYSVTLSDPLLLISSHSSVKLEFCGSDMLTAAFIVLFITAFVTLTHWFVNHSVLHLKHYEIGVH